MTTLVPSATRSQRRHHVAHLFVEHRAEVLRFAQQLGAPPADAEDICSQVFVIAFRRFDSFRGDAAPRTWLFGIARRVLSDRRRSKAVRTEVVGQPLPVQQLFTTPETELLVAEQRATVRRHVERLPKQQRNVIAGFCLSELPMDQVAAAARIPLQTAYARLYAGQQRLADSLHALA